MPKGQELTPLFVEAAAIQRVRACREIAGTTFAQFTETWPPNLRWAPNENFTQAHANAAAEYRHAVERLNLWLMRDLQAFQTRIDES